jgi:hypothetical protein
MLNPAQCFRQLILDLLYFRHNKRPCSVNKARPPVILAAFSVGAFKTNRLYDRIGLNARSTSRQNSTHILSAQIQFIG